MVYSWKNYGYAVDAETVGKQFESIERKYGEVTSQTVLETAKDIGNPMHELFEWDDGVAANQYRLHQASVLICNLAVEVETEEKSIVTRAYVNVSDDNNGSFVNVVTAFQSNDTKDIVLKRALQELIAFKVKYKNLNELSMVIKTIDEVIEKAN